jgi:hypothetical protein
LGDAPPSTAAAPSTTTAAVAAEGAGSGPGVYADMAAPLELLSSLIRLQQLLLADWSEPPATAGEEGQSCGGGCYN